MQFGQLRRREFITLLGGAAAAWPLAARAQQPERMRHIAILMLTADDADGQARITALREGLENLGWTEGVDTRWLPATPTAETAVSSRSRRWRRGDESVCVASRGDAAPDDDTI